MSRLVIVASVQNKNVSSKLYETFSYFYFVWPVSCDFAQRTFENVIQLKSAHANFRLIEP